MLHKEIICIIPARKGSKGIKNKNIKKINGKELIQYSIDTAKALLQLLAPFAPHLAEELWENLGGQPSIVNEPWPQARKELLVAEEVTIVFQVNGKLRGEGQFPKEVDKETVLSAAKADPKVQSFLEGKDIVKEIYVPGKLVNLAAKG